MKAAYFRDVKGGQLFKWNDDIWIKIVPTTYFVLGRNMKDALYARLMKSGVNAICVEPIDSDDDILVEFVIDNTLVELM